MPARAARVVAHRQQVAVSDDDDSAEELSSSDQEEERVEDEGEEDQSDDSVQPASANVVAPNPAAEDSKQGKSKASRLKISLGVKEDVCKASSVGRPKGLARLT